jgi:predicted PurR-regulated permease PerM
MRMKRSVGQYIVFGIILALFIAVIHRFILPVVLGLLISLVFRPIYLLLVRKFGNRNHLAASVSTLLLVIGVLLPLILIGASVAEDIAHFVNSMAALSRDPDVKNGKILQIPVVSELHRKLNAIYPISEETFTRNVRSLAASGGKFGGTFLTGLAASIPRLLVAIVFFLVAFYFGLIDGPKFVDFLKANLPFTHKECDELFERTHKICKAVVLGALMAGLVQGAILGSAYWLLGIPRPFLAVVVTLISSFIPLMGSAPAGIAGTVYLLAKGRIGAAIVMLALFLLASVSDNIVKPWVLKGKTELHPMLGLLSVLGGLTVFGVAGLFLGPIITALTITFLQLRQTSRKEEHLHGEEGNTNSKILTTS